MVFIASGKNEGDNFYPKPRPPSPHNLFYISMFSNPKDIMANRQRQIQRQRQRQHCSIGLVEGTVISKQELFSQLLAFTGAATMLHHGPLQGQCRHFAPEKFDCCCHHPTATNLNLKLEHFVFLMY